MSGAPNWSDFVAAPVIVAAASLAVSAAKAAFDLVCGLIALRGNRAARRFHQMCSLAAVVRTLPIPEGCKLEVYERLAAKFVSSKFAEETFTVIRKALEE